MMTDLTENRQYNGKRDGCILWHEFCGAVLYKKFFYIKL